MKLRKSLSFTRRCHRRQRHTRLWLMCIRVPMGRVQVICNFRNYNYWTGNAIGFRASRELCSHFLLHQVTLKCATQEMFKQIGLLFCIFSHNTSVYAKRKLPTNSCPRSLLLEGFRWFGPRPNLFLQSGSWYCELPSSIRALKEFI